ncbi:hypothetical protein OUZ56_008986 [Daphnia magna]|uniref:Uncharacterized protein n=1 Tax=Daphnia magna TaxID=35525 RepID=A0ABR0AEM3_9CRUS|nr:hypothetical protein OUZ56_008986 [Daphnia magna]
MDKVIIAVWETPKEVDDPDGESNQTDATVDMALSMLTRSEIEYASQSQYIRDFAMDISNHLAREIRNLQSENLRAANHAPQRRPRASKIMADILAYIQMGSLVAFVRHRDPSTSQLRPSRPDRISLPKSYGRSEDVLMSALQEVQ